MVLLKTGAFLLAGLASGYIVPGLAQKIIKYKCTKRQQSIPVFNLPRWQQLIIMLVSTVLFALAGWKMPVPEALLVCSFVLMALTATVIDIKIRIIANEMVLLLLVLGLIYRITVGGVHSLLGSLVALALVMAVFIGTSFINKLLRGSYGVGAGDIKLAMAIAITVGYSTVFYFLIGMALAVGGYCLAGMRLGLLTPKNTLPMCGHIMVGFCVALFAPYVLL